MTAAATTVVATAGLAAAAAGPASASGPRVAGHTPAALHVSSGQSMRALATGHAAATRTGGQQTSTDGASHHPFKHVKLAVADHGRHGATERQAGLSHRQDPARHIAVIQHHAAAAKRTAPAKHTAPAKRTAPAKHTAPARKHAAPAKRPAPYLVYDSTVPSALPTKHVAAAYATGSYAASPSQLAGHKKVVWIDTTGRDPAASALDVEPGDATPAQAATWAFHRLRQHPQALAIIYTMRSEWSATQQAIAGLPHHMQDHVRWWIADPTGHPHVVPGSAATQWYWGTKYDITTATPRF